jgi:hypothetical protein
MFYIIAKYAHGKFMKIQKGTTKKPFVFQLYTSFTQRYLMLQMKSRWFLKGGGINYNLSSNSHAQGLCPLSTIFINNGCIDVLNYV